MEEKCCEKCIYFDKGVCEIDNEAKDDDMICKYFDNVTFSIAM